MRVFCENVKTRPPLDYMYSDISECPGLQMPDYEKKHQQKLERPKLPLKSSCSDGSHDKGDNSFKNN